MSVGFTPAIAKARGAARSRPRSSTSLRLISSSGRSGCPSAPPSTMTGVCGMSFAMSARVTMMAAAQSVSTQQSSLRSGSLM